MASGQNNWEEKITVPTPLATDHLNAPGHALRAWQFAEEKMFLVAPPIDI